MYMSVCMFWEQARYVAGEQALMKQVICESLQLENSGTGVRAQLLVLF